MPPTSSNTSKTVEKALSLLVGIVTDGGQRPVSDIASELGIPVSTAHRLTGSFLRHGLVSRERPGHCQPGVVLAQLAQSTDLRKILQNVGRVVLNRHARRYRRVMHIGILEDEMLTYLVRAGPQHHLVMTSDGVQLEAYCSSMGKVLLANIPKTQLRKYLNDYPFIKLTAQTIVDPDVLASEIEKAASNGYAINDREFHEGICSVAIPIVIGRTSHFVAAISMLIPSRQITDANILDTLEKLNFVRAQLIERLEPHFP